MNKKLTGKVALVTGGSRGIGAAIARSLADGGADVGISYVQAGFLLALYPGIGLLATPLGVVVDYVSRRVMAAVGGIGYGIGLCLFAVAGNFKMLFVAVAVMGLIGDALTRAVEVALVDVTGDKIEPALARSNLLAAVGELVGPLLLAASLDVLILLVQRALTPWTRARAS